MFGAPKVDNMAGYKAIGNYIRNLKKQQEEAEKIEQQEQKEEE